MTSNKDQLTITIYTFKHKITGNVHLYENSRMSDLLNTENISKDFVPITNAEILDLKTQKVEKLKFISVNKKMIEFVYEH